MGHSSGICYTISVVLWLLHAWPTSVFAQQNITAYGMKSLPQRTFINPALRCDSRLFVGIPGLSSVYADFSNSSLQFSKLADIMDRKSEDSVVINFNKIPDLFRDHNSLTAEFSLDLVHVGFELGDNNFFSINSSLMTSGKLSFPGDLPKLLFQGNGGDNLAYRFDLSSRVDFLQYLEMGIGYSRRLDDDKWAIGIRMKYLRGLMNLNTERSDIRFRTDPGNYNLLATSDIRINYTSNFNGFVDQFDASTDQDLNEMFRFRHISDVFGTSNNGWGLDLGATYDLNKKIELSGSLINIGRIYWNEGAHNYTSRESGQEFVFEGMKIDNLDSLRNPGYLFNTLIDTLSERFGLDSSHEAYSTGLFPEFYLGGTLSLTKNHRVGALFYGDWYQRRLHPGVSLTWYSQIGRSVSFTASYTIIDHSFTNLGLGAAANFGPFQIYLLSDNVFQVLAPDRVRNWNARFGMNLTFLRKPKEKKEYEKK